ncbi:MAG: class I SAM-dependent methyltransferase [Candidatus Nanohaloarchaea archaeon]
MREDVKEGYEEADYEGLYREGREIRPEEEELFQKLFDKLGSSGQILDLGCGTGLPFNRYIIDNGYDLIGVDIAEKHVEKARENVPEAEIVQGDFFEVDIDNKSLNAVVSFYAIFHIPREEHRELFEQINDWLKPEGYILVTVASTEMENLKESWNGAEIQWSSYEGTKTLEIIEESGFEIIETYEEDWRDEDHLWVLASKQ